MEAVKSGVVSVILGKWAVVSHIVVVVSGLGAVEPGVTPVLLGIWAAVSCIGRGCTRCRSC